VAESQRRRGRRRVVPASGPRSMRGWKNCPVPGAETPSDVRAWLSPGKFATLS
jgi:hypothetical protein